ncbi:conjugal transfer protein TrbI [Novosphingobium guangzhouense]|uniref:Conjugal transfer protein TrbI n=1 Tax=Novosphingobium guangzhouense TaxID=1850347 RepID=A0A2K2FYA0_9SPHN|nr:conjugal transfer protein TrbI [Novosphingobium guangzhouense]
MKIAPEGLILRASPRRIVRFRRGVVIGGTAAGALAIAGVTWMALGERVTRLADASGAQLVNDRRTTAEAVADLPGDYSAVAKGTPVLGPPLPGDLGRPILARQRDLAGSNDASSATPPPPSAAEQAAEAERQRLASQAHQAREAGVLMQTAGQGGAASQAMSLDPAVVASTVNETAKLALDPEHDQNNQQRKIDFLEKQPFAVASTTSAHRLEGPTSPFQVMAGSVVSASLMTGINSDLPGTVVAQVTENVFDTVTGHILLIPQGSRLIGSYDSVVAFGQKRALLAWQRIILPDGSSIQLDNVPASDTAGYSGLADGVDIHTWQLLKGVALSTLLGVGTELSLGSNEGDLLRAIRQSTQQSAGQAGQQIVSKNLNVQPTITIRPGWPLRVIVHKDIVLRPWGGAR